MSVRIAADGKTYGTWPVLMTKGIEVMIGTRQGRYGGVLAEYEGKPHVEEPDSWWNERGFVITDPDIPKAVKPPLPRTPEEIADKAISDIRGHVNEEGIRVSADDLKAALVKAAMEGQRLLRRFAVVSRSGGHTSLIGYYHSEDDANVIAAHWNAVNNAVAKYSVESGEDY